MEDKELDLVINENLNINEEKNVTSEKINISISSNETNQSNQELKKEYDKIIKKDEEKNEAISKKIKEKKEIKAEISKNKNYNQIVKDYLTQSTQDTKYDEQIKDNPISLFDSIDEQKIKSWESSLYKLSPNTIKISKDKEQDILSELIQTKEQVVIKNDCKRTRVRESRIYNNYIQILERVLTYYCYKYKATYKQGLNEIFGPLVLMQYKLTNYSIVSIINLGARLIDVFLPNYF